MIENSMQMVVRTAATALVFGATLVLTPLAAWLRLVLQWSHCHDADSKLRLLSH